MTKYYLKQNAKFLYKIDNIVDLILHILKNLYVHTYN